MKQGGDIFYQEGDAKDYPIFKDAVRAKQYELVEYALSLETESAAFLNNKDQSLSAQFLAYKDPKMFDILIKAGGDPFYGGKDGVCPVKKAIEKGSIAILPVLSKNKSDLKHITEGKTLLEWAVSNKRPDWINGLIAEGALKDVEDSEKNRLLEIAKAEGDENNEIIELLSKG